MNSLLTSGFDPVFRLSDRLVEGHLLIDNSTLDRFVSCPRKFYISSVRKRRINKDQPALNFGGAVHAGLEYRYKTALSHEPSDLMKQDMFRVASDYLTNSYKGEFIADYRNHDYLKLVLDTYNSSYGDEPWSIALDKDGKPLVECPFMLFLGAVEHNNPNLPNPLPVYWTGKIDAIIKWHDNTYSTLDHKTSAMSGAYYFREYLLSQAQIGYALAARQQGFPELNTFMINALFCRKPAASGKINIELQRERIFLHDSTFREWIPNTLNIVRSIIHADALGYPAHFGACISKYGPCANHDLCTLPPDVREQTLMSGMYADDEWSPLSE